MKIFLSHSARDKALIREIRSHLKYMNTWMDEDKLLIGEPLDGTIQAAIQEECDYVIVFLSSAAIHSVWVKRELQWAIEREKHLGRVFVLPVLLEDVWKQVEPAAFQERLYISCLDQSKSTVERVAKELGQHLFQHVAALLDGASHKMSMSLIKTLDKMEPLRKRSEIPDPITHAREASEICILVVDGATIINSFAQFYKSKLQDGCNLRIILLNSDNQNILETWYLLTKHTRTKRHFENTIDFLGELVNLPGAKGKCEIHMSKVFLPYSIFGKDFGKESGSMIVEYQSYKVEADDRPHILLTAADNQYWFRYYENQFNSVWNESETKLLSGHTGAADSAGGTE